MIEGAPSRDLEKTKTVMYTQPETWRMLMKKLTEMVKGYLDEQVKHGVDAIQLFDSWVGSLSREDSERYVTKYTRRSSTPSGTDSDDTLLRQLRPPDRELPEGVARRAQRGLASRHRRGLEEDA